MQSDFDGQLPESRLVPKAVSPDVLITVLGRCDGGGYKVRIFSNRGDSVGGPPVEAHYGCDELGQHLADDLLRLFGPAIVKRIEEFEGRPALTTLVGSRNSANSSAKRGAKSDAMNGATNGAVYVATEPFVRGFGGGSGPIEEVSDKNPVPWQFLTATVAPYWTRWRCYGALLSLQLHPTGTPRDAVLYVEGEPFLESAETGWSCRTIAFLTGLTRNRVGGLMWSAVKRQNVRRLGQSASGGPNLPWERDEGSSWGYVLTSKGKNWWLNTKERHGW